MHIVAGFNSNKFVEMAIQEVEDIGINKEKIVIIEMRNEKDDIQVFDSKSYSDGDSILDGIAACAVIVALFGIIFGSRLVIGPLATGMIGCAIGGAIGFLIEKVIRKKKGDNKFINYVDFIIIINCATIEQLERTASTFKKYHVVSLGYH